MSNDLAMTMDELERESAELLPSRETLCCSHYSRRTAAAHYNSYDFTQVGGSNYGGISILSGNVVNVLSFL